MTRAIACFVAAFVTALWTPASVAEADVSSVCSPLPKARFEAAVNPASDPLLAAISSSDDETHLRRVLVNEDINASRGSAEFTPLSLAAAADNVVAVQVLLDAGADPNLPSSDGTTPLEMALQYARIASACVLLRAGAQTPPPSTFAYLLPAASATEDFQAAQDTVGLLINFGYDVNARVMGDTALHIAAELGNAALVDTLLEHGADTTLTNNRGEMAEAVALRFAHHAIARRIARVRAGP